MKTFEMVITTVAVLAAILSLFLIPGGDFLIIISFSTLSLFYLICSFMLLNDFPFSDIFNRVKFGLGFFDAFGSVFTGNSLSMTLIGILFKLMSWPAANLMLLIGGGSLAIAFVAAAIRFALTRRELYRKVLVRAAIVGAIALILYNLPAHAWFEFKYRNYPAYVEAAKESFAHPRDDSARAKMLEERRKIDFANRKQ